jgi:hypothetical protein
MLGKNILLDPIILALLKSLGRPPLEILASCLMKDVI